MTNISFTNCKTECQQLDSDVSTLKNDCTSILQHFRVNSCIRIAGQTMQLCFTCFGGHHSFHPTTNGASVSHSTAINTDGVTVDVSHWYFFATKNSVTAHCLYGTSLTDSNLKPCSVSAVRKPYNFLLIAGSLEFASPKISHSQFCYWPWKKTWGITFWATYIQGERLFAWNMIGFLVTITVYSI